MIYCHKNLDSVRYCKHYDVDSCCDVYLIYDIVSVTMVESTLQIFVEYCFIYT